MSFCHRSAATLISAAAEGSVRDSLSLLDQAIAMHTDEAGQCCPSPAESVRDMLGLADKITKHSRLTGTDFQRPDGSEALAAAQKLHLQGADPATLLSDLMDITHYLTRIVVAPALVSNLNYSPAEQGIATSKWPQELSVPALTRAWQILTKGTEEMRHADHTASILEMVLVRLGYASTLPTPAELVKSLQNTGGATSAHSPLEVESKRASASVGGTAARNTPHEVAKATSASSQGGSRDSVAPCATTTMIPAGNVATAAKLEPIALAEVHSFLDVVKLFEAHREALLANHLISDMRLVTFEQGRIEMKPIGHMTPDVPARINRRLTEWTGVKWNLIYNENAPVTRPSVNSATSCNVRRANMPLPTRKCRRCWRCSRALPSPITRPISKFSCGVPLALQFSWSRC